MNKLAFKWCFRSLEIRISYDYDYVEYCYMDFMCPSYMYYDVWLLNIFANK